MTAADFVRTQGITISLYHNTCELWYRTFHGLERAREYLAANKPALQHHYTLSRWQFTDEFGEKLGDDLIDGIRNLVFGDPVTV